MTDVATETVLPELVDETAAEDLQQLRHLDLRGADLRDLDLTDMDLGDLVLRGADLRCSTLNRANLATVDARGADFRGSDLRGAALTCADLRGADLRGALIDRNTRFDGALITAAKVDSHTHIHMAEAGARGRVVLGYVGKAHYRAKA